MRNKNSHFYLLFIIILALLILCGFTYETDEVALAKVVYLEARGESTYEQSLVCWCVLNRVDSERYPDTIQAVIRQKYQFAYRKNAPVNENILNLCKDVIARWKLEKIGLGDVGRTLPKEYVYFAGHHGHNWFRKDFRGKESHYIFNENPYYENASN